MENLYNTYKCIDNSELKPIKNKYIQCLSEYLDIFDIKIYQVLDNVVKIYVERTDKKEGWGQQLQIVVGDNDGKLENICVGSSEFPIKEIIYKTDVKLIVRY